MYDNDGDGGGGVGGEGEGEGEGEGAGAGEGEGEGEGTGGEGQGDNSPKARMAKALALKSDDDYVRVPGIKDPVRVGDLKQAYGLRTQNEQNIKVMGAVAQILRERQGQAPQKSRQQQQQRQQQEPRRRASDQDQDPLAQIERMDVIDGKTVAAMFRGLQAQLGKVLPTMGEGIKDVRTRLSHHDSARDEQAFMGEVSKAIDALKLPVLDGKRVEGSEILNDLARDLYLSYADEDQPRLLGEPLQKLVKARFDGLRKMFKALDKAELESAKLRQKQRLFSRKGQSTGANGKGRLLTNRELADAAFAGEANT